MSLDIKPKLEPHEIKILQDLVVELLKEQSQSALNPLLKDMILIHDQERPQDESNYDKNIKG